MKKFLLIAVALIAAIFIFLTVYKKQPVAVTDTTEQVQDMPAQETQPAPEVAPVDTVVDAAPQADTTAPVEAPAN